MEEIGDLEALRRRAKKILVVRSDNLGDVICTMPAIEALRLAFPDAFIAALVADYTREVLEGNPFLDHVYSYQKAKHSDESKPVAWFKQWQVLKEIRAEGFDLAFGIRSRFTKSHAWLVYMSKAPLRVGHRPEKAGMVSSAYYNIFVDDELTGEEEVHEVEKSLNVVRRVGVDIEEKRLTLDLPEDRLKEADDFIEAEGLKRGRALVCLHVTSRPEHDRFWPVEHYVELIDLVAARDGVDLVLNWMQAEDETVAEIMARVKEKPVAFKASGIKGFAAFLNRCEMLVTLEGGAMHIGAAAPTTVIAIFGKTSTNVWAPWGEGNITLKHGALASLVKPAEVFAAIDTVLKRRED